MVFAYKTATFGAELQVSVGPRPHQSFCACKTAWWDSGSIGSSPYLCFLHAKQRVLEQNYKSLWVPALILGFCMQNSGFWTKIGNLYWSQISRVVLCLQSSVISPRTICLYGSQPFSAVFECKTATFGAELQVCMGPRPHLSFCACKSAWLAP